MSEPICPGCGNEMEPYGFRNGSWRYACRICAIPKKGVKAITRGWLSPTRSTKEIAKRSALKRSMQKPLDLRPGNCHLKTDDNGITPIFIEHRFTNNICAGVYCEALDVFCYIHGFLSPEITNDISGWFDNEEQGQTWRCWERYPTEEEREAAPWAELRGEGLEW